MRRIYFTDNKNKLANDRKLKGVGLSIDGEYQVTRNQILVGATQGTVNGSTKKQKIVAGDTIIVNGPCIEVEAKSNNKDALVLITPVFDSTLTPMCSIWDGRILPGSYQNFETTLIAIKDTTIAEILEGFYFELEVFA